MASSDFEVTMKKAEVVAPTLPIQDHWLSLSNLDLLLPPLDFGVFLCYKKQKNAEKMISCCMHDRDHDHDDNDNIVNAIKNSLAQALVCFYPYAGEVLQNRHGEPELLCNNQGVDFVHAYADIELKDLDLYRPEISIQGKLVPIKKKHGVLSVQVTKLKCGSLVVGCTFDHRVTDAYSANMFLITWAEMAQSKTPTYTPSFRRSMLDSRRPPIYDKSIDNMYVLLSTLPPPKQRKPGDDDQLISRIYYVKAEEIECLQSQASFHGGTRRTKLESFSAFLWKTIAEGGYDDIKRCRLGIVVDGRQRLNTRDDHKAALTMVKYFGNVLSVPYSDASVGELKKLPLNKVADMVHACIDSAANEEHFLGLIDWVELHRPQQGKLKVCCEDKDDEAAIVVSSGLRFPLSEVNFGWGVPDFVSYHFPWGGKTGYVMPMQSLSKDGDWVVYMYLFGRHCDLIEAKASHVFRPLNPYYLKITG